MNHGRLGSALVVNCSQEMTESNRSREFYNLGAAKLAGWLAAQGWRVDRAAGDPGMFIAGYDLICVSVIFSWHARTARDVALRAKDQGLEVWAGGPGLYALRSWFESETGIKPIWKPDDRFDRQRGKYKMTYATRGCAGEFVASLGAFRPCEWCIVPKIEGTAYVYDGGFIPAPFLLDNNLSGMLARTQEAIVARYREFEQPLLDANSGFEPSTFDIQTRKRWEPILRGPWRFAFDHSREEEAVRQMAVILSDVSPRRKRVYVLCGNEPLEVCYERARKVIEWGCEPYAQFEIPLNALDKYDDSTWTVKPRHGWTVALGRDFMRYFNQPGNYKSMAIGEYKPRVHEPPPFRGLAA